MTANRLIARIARLFFLSAAATPIVACAVPTDEESASTSQAICADPPCVPVDPPPPRPPPPPPPPPLPTYVTLAGATFEGAIVFALAGTQLSVDTTQSAPPLFGPLTTYPNPVFVQCQKDLAACALEPISVRAMCRAEVGERCAGVPSSITTARREHSYLAFGPAAKSQGANDVFFPLETMHHDGAVFSFSIDVNYIHATFGYNVTAGFTTGPTAATPASAWLRLSDIQSNSPTIILGGNYPDFSFSNMVATVSLDGLVPTSDGQSVDYSSVSSTFTFDWDANNVPDALVSTIVDVNGIVQDRVSKRIAKGFGNESAHTSLSKAFAHLVDREVRAVHPNGYARITKVQGVAGALRVYYVGK